MYSSCSNVSMDKLELGSISEIRAGASSDQEACALQHGASNKLRRLLRELLPPVCVEVWRPLGLQLFGFGLWFAGAAGLLMSRRAECVKIASRQPDAHRINCCSVSWQLVKGRLRSVKFAGSVVTAFYSLSTIVPRNISGYVSYLAAKLAALIYGLGCSSGLS